MKPIAMAAGLLLLALVSAGCGGSYDDGRVAYDAGDFSRAMDLWRPLADDGDARAQYAIGYMYDKGQGLPEADWEEAARWYRLAGEQGYLDAQYNLAILYHTARDGWRQDMKRAADWYMKAAEQDKTEAQYAVARMYYTGQGLPKNPELAAHWLERCTEKHDAKCMNLLGVIYRDGRGVEADVPRAVYLICQAAELGESGAQLNFAGTLARGVGVPSDMVEATRWRAIVAERDPEVFAAQPEWGVKLDDAENARARSLAKDWKPAADPREAAERCAGLAPR